MQLLSIPQVAERLNISVRLVRRLLDKGDLPWVNLSVGEKKPLKRVRESEVLALIERRRVQNDERPDRASRRLKILRAMEAVGNG